MPPIVPTSYHPNVDLPFTRNTYCSKLVKVWCQFTQPIWIDHSDISHKIFCCLYNFIKNNPTKKEKNFICIELLVSSIYSNDQSRTQEKQTLEVNVETAFKPDFLNFDYHSSQYTEYIMVRNQKNFLKINKELPKLMDAPKNTFDDIIAVSALCILVMSVIRTQLNTEKINNTS